MLQKSFLNKIKDFGINSYEGKLWTALLSRGISTAGELSEMANVPRSRSYDVLESLEKKGFVIMKLGKPIKYIAVPPKTVIERVQHKVKDDAAKHIELLDSLKDSKILDELSTLHSKGIDTINPSELVGILKGRNNLYNHIEAMLKSAKKSVHIVSTGSGIIRKLDYFRALFKKLGASGVSTKILVPLLKENVSQKKNFEVKINSGINSRFIVVDNKEVIFMPVDDTKVHPSYDMGIWINSPFFVDSFSNIFHQLWHQK